ncbi:uncharacterized protein LAESUDRAFT_754292 [Laetiporus sulphureus 93-53]|uniref:Uncharacterized protein n=1 Tax=Laetiporus sulphureus 93-53 TaxID=1314785 RepID=A0A165IN52_9APHY|nr:uncharacterized protein LAESUDRAFT_754292 [Laetiporus sulphureus 93-53]KZT13310.1 hypothetical protein LAESUDRAFT_754292 [Laetiporus sulphureus 93-53]
MINWFHRRRGERDYVSLLYKTTNCYASWDPLLPVEVGDYGYLQKDGSFAPKGNIFKDGLAERYDITKQVRGCDQIRWVTSGNAKEVSFDPNVNLSFDTIADAHLKYKFSFSGQRAALLAMYEPQLTSITYPARLSRLLSSQEWKNQVIVSEGYTCRSYARLLTWDRKREVTVGLGASAPIIAALGFPVSAGGGIDLSWKTSTHSCDWKARGVRLREKEVAEKEARQLCYPLFKLVALHAPPGVPASGLRARGKIEFELPDAPLPWENDGTSPGSEPDTSDSSNRG